MSYIIWKKLSHNSTLSLVQFISLSPHFASLWLFMCVCVCFLGASNMLWPYWHSIEVHFKTVWFRNILVWNNLWNLKHLESNQNRNVFVTFTLGLPNFFSLVYYYSFNHFACFFFFFEMPHFIPFRIELIRLSFFWSKSEVQLKRQTNNKMPIHLTEQFKHKAIINGMANWMPISKSRQIQSDN